MELSDIYAYIQDDLNEIEKNLASLSKVDYPHLSELVDYGLKSNGKRVRPVLTLLSGKFYQYDRENLITMAAAVEVLHTATLVHDDAIDNSSVRRGRPTINKIWGEEKAVLLGDYLFAEAGSLTANTQNLRVIKLFAETLKTISSGEINQADNSFNLNQDRQQYFQRIAKKTASLFSMATESGAALSEAPEDAIQTLIEYGYNLGVAFQIVDDILDFVGTEEELGKPVGSDLAQGTLTLPAMLLLEKYPEDNPIKSLFENRGGQEYIKSTIDQITNSTIIEECYAVASDFCDKACRNIRRLPDKPSRESLTYLADYVIRRKK